MIASIDLGEVVALEGGSGKAHLAIGVPTVKYQKTVGRNDIVIEAALTPDETSALRALLAQIDARLTNNLKGFACEPQT